MFVSFRRNRMWECKPKGKTSISCTVVLSKEFVITAYSWSATRTNNGRVEWVSGQCMVRRRIPNFQQQRTRRIGDVIVVIIHLSSLF